MTKRQDLYLQRRSRPEQSDQRQPNQAANISHQPRASPNSTPLASRIEFPTMTADQLGVFERSTVVRAAVSSHIASSGMKRRSSQKSSGGAQCGKSARWVLL